MRLVHLTTLFALVAVACAAPADSGPTVTAPPPVFVATATTRPPPPIEAPRTVTLEEIDASPLTEDTVTIEDLALMPLRELGPPFAGFIPYSTAEEPNEAVLAALTNSVDAAEDMVRFGRQTGYRARLRPTRFSDTATRYIDTWVELFSTPRGASGYLIDYIGDLAKGRDAAYDANLNVTGSHPFDVEEVGDEAVGIVVIEASDSGDPSVETVVGMRIGRLLAFVSVVRGSDVDIRVAALALAEELQARVVGVLDGSLQPIVETEPPAVLDSYAFEYVQQLEQNYKVVESTVVDNGLADDEASEEEEEEETEPPEPDAPTTTISWIDEETATSITARGTVTTEATKCTITLRNNGRRSNRGTYIITDDAVWRSTNGHTWKLIDRSEERYRTDLLYCPGWYPSRGESGVRSITRPGRGEIEELADGTMRERYDLGLAELVAAGLAGENGRGLRVQKFTLWTGGDGPWVVGVDLRVSGPTSAMEGAFGPAFYPRASATISVFFETSQINDPELTIEVPEATE